MSTKAKLLGGLSATLLLLLIATGLLLSNRLALIIQACDRFAGLDCQIDSLELSATHNELKLLAGDIHIATPEQGTMLASQYLALTLNWRELFDRKLTLQQLNWEGLSVDGAAVQQWLHHQFPSPSQPTAKEPPEELNEPTESPGSWQVIISDLKLANWQFLVPVNGKSMELKIDELTSSRNIEELERPLLIKGSFEGRPINVKATMTLLLYSLRQHKPFELDLSGDIAGIKINTKGEVDFYNDDYESWFDFDIEARAIPDIAALFGIKLPVYEELTARGRIHERVGKAFDLEQLALKLKTSNDLRIDISGRASNITANIEPEIVVDLNISSLKRLLTFFDIDTGVDLEIQAQAELDGENGLLVLNNFDAGVNLNGASTHYGKQYTLADSKATLEIPLQQLLTQDDFKLPLLLEGGTLSANVDIDADAFGFDIGIHKLPITITGTGLGLNLEGSYKQTPLTVDFGLDEDWGLLVAKVDSELVRATSRANLATPVMTFDNHIELVSHELLTELIKVPLPPIESLLVDAALHIGDKVVLDSTKLSLTNNTLAIETISKWNPSKQSQEITLDVNSNNASHLAEFIQQIEFDLKHLPPVNFILGTLATRTSVDLSQQKQIPTLKADDWLKVVENNPWSLAPTTLKSSINLQADQLTISSFSWAMKGRYVDSHIGGAARFKKDDISIDLKIDSAFKPGAFEGLNEPFSLRGSVASDEQVIRSDDLFIGYDDGEGHIKFSLDNSKPEKRALTASIKVQDLDLAPIIQQYQENESLVQPEEEAPPTAEEAELKTEIASDGRVIPELPLPVEWTRTMELDIDYQIEQLNLDIVAIKQWQGSLTVADGVFDWPENTLALLGGDIIFNAHIDTTQATPYWQLAFQAERLNPIKLNLDRPSLLDGPMSARVELSGYGDNTRSLLASLDGRVSLGMNEVTLHGANLNALAPNFIKSTLRILNPFSGKNDTEEETYFECGVFHALLDDGFMLADKSILARTRETDIAALWQLDLKTEKQVIQAYPKQRATIAIPTGDLASAVEISGTLAKPKIGVNNRDLVTGSAKTAFFFVGGWVYVMSKNEWDKSREEESACQQARDYWLAHSLQEMQQHEMNNQEKKAAKKAERIDRRDSRPRSRKPR